MELSSNYKYMQQLSNQASIRHNNDNHTVKHKVDEKPHTIRTSCKEAITPVPTIYEK